ncbi:DUF5990 family protein [Streptomyces avermitilis]|uniref:DUF5990 family protein n=1 Tax=Streptomyces avermitilis TaxID=33903 RepID=UPI0033AF0B8C
MRIRIDAVDLPGRTCPPGALVGDDIPAYLNIYVAVQRRDHPAELLDPSPGDAPSATRTLEWTRAPTGRVRGLLGKLSVASRPSRAVTHRTLMERSRGPGCPESPRGSERQGVRSA